MDICCRKQTLYQPSHNHCPKSSLDLCLWHFFPIYNFRFRTFRTRTLFVLADSNTSVLGVSGRKCTTRLSATRTTRSSTPPPRTTSSRRSFSVQRILFRRPPSSCSLCSSWPQRTSTLISSHLKSTLEKVLTCYEDGWSLSSC